MLFSTAPWATLMSHASRSRPVIRRVRRVFFIGLTRHKKNGQRAVARQNRPSQIGLELANLPVLVCRVIRKFLESNSPTKDRRVPSKSAKGEVTKG